MEFLKKSSRISFVLEETKISASPTESSAYYELSNTTGTPANFITECFFLALNYIHYGFLKSARTFTEMNKDMHELRNVIERIESQRHVWAANPAAAAMTERKLKELKVP